MVIIKNYYGSKSQLMNASLEDKIDTMLYLNAKSIEQSSEILSKYKDLTINDFKERNIKIGALVLGEAYYHEVDQYYPVIGFMVESESEFRGVRSINYGFRGIYFGRCHKTAPIDFDEATSLNDRGQIGNGFGDYVNIEDVLINEEEVNHCIKKNQIDINHYLKEIDFLLPFSKENVVSKNDKNVYKKEKKLENDKGGR